MNKIKKTNIFKISFIFTIITFLSKFIGLLRDSLIANVYGATYITDSYNTAQSIPNILYMIGVGSILITFVPNFCEVENELGENEAYKFTNKFLSLLLLIVASLFFIVLIFTRPIVEIVVPGFNQEAKALTIILTKIMSINIILIALVAVFSAILRIKQKMIAVSFMPLVASVPIVIYLILDNNANPIILTVITCLGYLLQILILLPEIKSAKYKFKFTLRGYNDRIILAFKSIIPIMFGFATTQISLLVDSFVASSLKQGSITAIQLSSKVSNIVYSVLMSSITTVFFPHLSNLYSQKKMKEWCVYIEQLIKIIMLLMIPFTGLLLILNKEIIMFLFQRGEFGQYGSNLTTLALMGYCIQLPFMAMTDIIAQAMYSSKDTKRPAYFGMIAVAINIFLTIVLSKKFELFGITFATSISSIIGSIMLIISFKKKYQNFDLNNILILTIKIFIITILDSTVVFFIRNLCIYSNFNSFIIILICGFFGVIVQILLYFLVLRSEISIIKKFIKEK